MPIINKELNNTYLTSVKLNEMLINLFVVFYMPLCAVYASFYWITFNHWLYIQEEDTRQANWRRIAATSTLQTGIKNRVHQIFDRSVQFSFVICMYRLYQIPLIAELGTDHIEKATCMISAEISWKIIEGWGSNLVKTWNNNQKLVFVSWDFQ